MAVLHVAEYLALVNETLRLHISSEEIVIEGEVSDFRVAQEKWVSFDLKDSDSEAILKCFMTIWQLPTRLEDGWQVRVRGSAKIYERYGTFKFNVSAVQPVGEGALRRAYELMKKKLEAEGLFDPSRKRPLPRFPNRIGLITSRDAAAYGDFLRILQNRWSGTEIDFLHIHVQGKEAVDDILHAIKYFHSVSEEDQPDVLVLIRGGGGLEDLHAFNDERVARAVFQSKIPMVCGVGHERDESLCDFAADVRASTPSNAAERVVPNRREVLFEMATMARHIEERLLERVAHGQRTMDRLTRAMLFVLDWHQERVQTLSQWVTERMNNWLPRLRERLEAQERMLRNLDPKHILERGYAIVTTHGQVIKNTAVLETGQEIGVQLAGGGFDAEILRINGKGRQKLL
ncbi:MAG: Exodeoxyribonuclease 7 large subunit [Candidatus Uhrbacteria bacterium GW2011_GWF2_41_16]|uniref:Exodeoxyribonuclease 7 large subunit n=2 Tax=Candidatus Uhriibacteriota TaxID=1752732 RepID=A0A0G0VCD6_9BACT|nr:MAG: Exodeoxyribonuclease 7 large subunit [Candidatus Uhrbacteria bacterium GW2011_GWA2_41_10]KKR87599.1 MAG: Exodeoxyribonuclease 7 large subunit [Candidatus Uhrbacteria bacterium GW2011_GWC2_41_11]KKR98579.1 MAG: Exodeoxyribonuclease 7 large subunit [Candidatus Uhrbacteria bacterium GW2011_GWF2_41_16]HBO99801.1 exodeoxyribonuclease VII large subunit [Candidatus Uhrbacteria bacterium]